MSCPYNCTGNCPECLHERHYRNGETVTVRNPTSMFNGQTGIIVESIRHADMHRVWLKPDCLCPFYGYELETQTCNTR